MDIGDCRLQSPVSTFICTVSVCPNSVSKQFKLFEPHLDLHQSLYDFCAEA